MIRTTLFALFAVMLCTCVGCQTSTVETYHISVTNKLETPVTIWLTKETGPYDKGLAPPEDEAMGTSNLVPAQARDIQPGQMIETTQKITIENGNAAVLRVYKAKDFDAILATDRGSLNRVDFSLVPGQTDLDIIRYEGRLAVVPRGTRMDTGPAR